MALQDHFEDLSIQEIQSVFVNNTFRTKFRRLFSILNVFISLFVTFGILALPEFTCYKFISKILVTIFISLSNTLSCCSEQNGSAWNFAWILRPMPWPYWPLPVGCKFISKILVTVFTSLPYSFAQNRMDRGTLLAIYFEDSCHGPSAL